MVESNIIVGESYVQLYVVKRDMSTGQIVETGDLLVRKMFYDAIVEKVKNELAGTPVGEK